MRLLVVYCHPVETSFTAAVHRLAVETLRRRGHELVDLDLYAGGFDPRMSRQDRLDYMDPATNQDRIAEHVAHLRWAEGVIFVFPTWWYGMPAMLKGWLERVWVPGVAFTLGNGLVPIERGLPHIRLLAGLTSYGSPPWLVWWAGNASRRIVTRALKPLCHPRCRSFWLAHYRMDTSTPTSRARHLARVEARLARLPLGSAG